MPLIFSRPGFMGTVFALFFSVSAAANSTNNSPNGAAATLVSGRAIQGGMMIFQTDPANKVTLDETALPVSPKGRFVIGFHRDDTQTQTLSITSPQGGASRLTLTPETRQWNIQRIDNLPTNMVTPPADVIARIQKAVSYTHLTLPTT